MGIIMKIRHLIKSFRASSDPKLRKNAEFVENSHKFLMTKSDFPKDIRESASEHCVSLIAEGINPLPFDDCTFEMHLEHVVIWVVTWKINSVICFSISARSKHGVVHGAALGKITLGELSYVATNNTDSKTNDNLAVESAAVAYSMLTVTLGLMSTGSGVSQDIVRVKDDKRRALSGKLPLEYEHTVVRIDPALLRLPGLVAAGGTHASPRLHWRRGHLRTLLDGRMVSVKPCIVGDVNRGVVTHDYVIG